MKAADSLRGLLLCALVIVNSAIPQDSLAQAGAIAAGESATAVISQLQSSLSQILRELEGVYSRSAFDTRTHIIALIQQLQLSSEALVGKTFSQVDKTEQKLFSDVRLAINDWNKGNKASLDSLGSTVTQLDSVLATLPLANTWPRVVSYDPSFVVRGKEGATVDVHVYGSWLGEGSPTLTIGKDSCDRTSKTEHEVQFRCHVKGSASATGVAPEPVAGVLTVEFRRVSVWDSVRGFIGLAKTRNYDIGFSAIPEELGTYTGEVTVTKEQIETQTRNEGCSHHNDHCQGGYGLTCAMTASQGWEVDPNTVNAAVSSKNDESAFDGVYDKTTNGFQLRATVRNSGSCGPTIPFTDRHVPVDGRGQVTLSVTWQEHRKVSAPTSLALPPGKLTWGSQISIPLAENTTAVTLRIKRADGGSDVVTGSGHFGWIDAEFRPDAKSLILRPLAPADALKN